jgi:CubicO group peptidase (beta-lactamase class C family)
MQNRRAAPLEFDPGERWQYGIGMDIVGRIVEVVSDQSLEVYFRENIFAPLDMADTGFLISTAQKQRTTTNYARQADGSLKAFPFEMPQRPSSPGVVGCFQRHWTTWRFCKCSWTTQLLLLGRPGQEAHRSYVHSVAAVL